MCHFHLFTEYFFLHIRATQNVPLVHIKKKVIRRKLKTLLPSISQPPRHLESNQADHITQLKHTPNPHTPEKRSTYTRASALG